MSLYRKKDKQINKKGFINNLYNDIITNTRQLYFLKFKNIMTPFFYGDYMAYGEIPILNTIIDYKVLSDETVYTKINFK